MEKAKYTNAFFPDGDPEAGQELYLVEVEWTNTGHLRYDFHAEPQRTNVSGEQRVEGWLGTTDNIDRQAQGKWRVTKVHGTNKLGNRFTVSAEKIG